MKLVLRAQVGDPILEYFQSDPDFVVRKRPWGYTFNMYHGGVFNLFYRGGVLESDPDEFNPNHWDLVPHSFLTDQLRQMFPDMIKKVNEDISALPDLIENMKEYARRCKEDEDRMLEEAQNFLDKKNKKASRDPILDFFRKANLVVEHPQEVSMPSNFDWEIYRYWCKLSFFYSSSTKQIEIANWYLDEDSEHDFMSEQIFSLLDTLVREINQGDLSKLKELVDTYNALWDHLQKQEDKIALERDEIYKRLNEGIDEDKA